jgi:hypothetical protein
MQTDKITIQNPLQPAILRVIREAFDAAIEEAALRRRGHALSLEMEARVAKHIVETARKGVNDRDGLRDAALGLLPH